MSHCKPPSCNCFVGRCYNNVILVTNCNNVKSACFDEMIDMVKDTEVLAEGLGEAVDQTVVEVMNFKKKKEVFDRK